MHDERRVRRYQPSLHDLLLNGAQLRGKHGFAVTVLLRWYRAGIDVQVKLPLLAAYMGHVSIVSTAYYLQFVEPLAAAASARFADHCGALITPTPDGGGAR